MMEVLDAGRDAVLTHSHPIEDGWVVLNDEPGLGFTFDEEKLKQCAPQPAEPGSGFSWGRRRGAGMYLVGRMRTWWWIGSRKTTDDGRQTISLIADDGFGFSGEVWSLRLRYLILVCLVFNSSVFAEPVVIGAAAVCLSSRAVSTIGMSTGVRLTGRL